MRRVALCIVAPVVMLALACGSNPTGAASPRPSPTPSPTLLTADQVVAKLKAAGQPIGQITIFTAANDPNSLLGRPHQYASKATWVDTSLPTPPDPTDISAGGSVETFASSGDLQTRSAYVANIAKTPLFAEYDYTSANGLVFLRLSAKLTPDQATAYVNAAKSFLPDLTTVTV